MYPPWPMFNLISYFAGIPTSGELFKRKSMLHCFPFLLFCAFILTNSYTAKLVSFNTVHIDRNIDTLEKLANHPEHDILIYKGSVTAQAIKVTLHHLKCSVHHLGLPEM